MAADQTLSTLLTWFSPSYPIGAYTYSHGLEQAFEQGLVVNEAGVVNWLEGIVSFGSAKQDACFLLQAYDLAETPDLEALIDLNREAASMRATSELALENEAQGRAFLKTLCAVDADPFFPAVLEKLNDKGLHPVYSVMMGMAGARKSIPKAALLEAYLYAFCANGVSAAVRLIPLGQIAGQRILAALKTQQAQSVQELLKTDLDFSASSVMLDIVSACHETQYSRLFRS